jgi:membrane fusion protein, adhesin transport system
VNSSLSSGKTHYLMVLVVCSLFLVFLIWANYTHLDLVTKGSGRVVAQGQNKTVQAPELATISNFWVEEGSEVSTNDIIATISPTEALGILEELQTRLSNLNVRLIRLDAELVGQTIDDVKNKLSSSDPLIVAAETDLMASRLAGLNSKLKSLDQELSKSKSELESLEAEKFGKLKILSFLLAEKEEIMPLVVMGALGSSERYRLEREEASITTELEMLDQKRASALLTTSQVETQIDSVRKDFRTDVFKERAEVISQIGELKARLPNVQERVAKTDIRSPIDGVINQVFFNTVGAVVSGGEVLAEIVPSGGELQVEAFVDPSDIATVEPGQSVRISLTAYEATKYGYILGTLTKVAADTIYREETRSNSYVVMASLDTELVEDNGKAVLVSPGMVAQVDIIRGDRSILEYFWQPIAKLKDSAFRE